MRRMPALILALATALATAAPAPAQQAATPTLDIPAGWLQGYARTVSATQVIAYPWAYPGQVSTLLVRAVDGTWRVEWEGQAGAGRAAGRTRRLSVARRARVRLRRPPVHADGQRHAVRDVHVGPRRHRPHVDGAKARTAARSRSRRSASAPSTNCSA